MQSTDVMAQTPPVLHGPSEKEKKYDRQLRLWAASGQAALESANILMVPSEIGTVGVEILKNLVLPGIGKFTIYDPKRVRDHDLGVNFFLDEDSLGKPRAQCCTEFLKELNPEVQGDWFPKTNGSTFEDFLEESSSDPFTMIVYTLPIWQEGRHKPLMQYAIRHNTPYIAVHSTGFYSYFQVSLPGPFPIVETHPDAEATADLRLLAPWPELSNFAKEMTKDIDNLNDHDHGHLPMVVILLHYLDRWKTSHGGAYPTAYADKIAFRKIVDEGTRKNNPEGGEENFEEAVAAVMKHVVAPSIPSSSKEVLSYAYGLSENSEFGAIAQAVKSFHEKHGVLPVAGGLPDMKAQSNVYIQLQNLYKEKARQDANEVLEIVRTMLGGVNVDSVEVELFCTNARFLKLINSYRDEKVDLEEIVKAELAKDEIAAIAGPEMPLTLIPIYLAMRCVENDTDINLDNPLDLESLTARLRRRFPFAADNQRVKEVIKEVWRAGNGELHNISALTGGMVAQEIIKIVTKQYIPIENACIFDGIQSRCQVFRL